MVKEIRFKREYYLHMLTQKYLKELFDLKIVASEIQHKRLRFDNLAFDEKTNSFVIIEYKNKFDRNVLRQARKYSNLIKKEENQKYFISRLERKTNVDFEKTRIMIIGPKFSEKQIKAAKDKDYELWKNTLFDDCTVKYENLKDGDCIILTIDPDDLKITEEKLLDKKSEEMRNLYEKLKNSINEFSDVEINFLVNQFSLRANDNLLCIVEFLKSSFNIYFYADSLNNAERTIDISNKSTEGKAKYKLKYKSDADLDYFLNLFKQVYNQKK